jgi:hypothetical protein
VNDFHRGGKVVCLQFLASACGGKYAPNIVFLNPVANSFSNFNLSWTMTDNEYVLIAMCRYCTIQSILKIISVYLENHDQEQQKSPKEYSKSWDNSDVSRAHPSTYPKSVVLLILR